jgi:signal transduction histidine kinase
MVSEGRNASGALRRGVVAVLAALWLVSTASEGLPASPADSAWELRTLAFTLAVAIFMIDVWRPVLPAWLVALGVAVPAAWLNVVDVGSVAMVFVVGIVGWLAYSRRRSAAVVGSIVALGSIVSYLPDRDTSGLLGVVVVSGATFVSVSLVGRQQELLAELRATQRELASQAAAEERRRIAAEIHDVVAHSLAVTLLQLTGARMIVKRTGGDARAIEALADAERIGRSSMSNLRRVVGLLREPGQAPEPPLAGPSAIGQLVEEYRHAGLPVTFNRAGDLGRLEPAVVLALYRISQEALANVVKHAAGGRTRVDLAVTDHVELVVANDLPKGTSATPDDGSSYGISGMRDRAALLGGTLTAQPVDSRWVVRASLPVGEPSQAPEFIRNS